MIGKNDAADEQVIALKALAFIAEGETRLERFLKATGMDLVSLRNAASDPSVLAGVLDYLLVNEGLLLAFCESAGLSPDQPARARTRLPGSPADEK